uniref:NAD(P)(+)--arginine ADP-ribosyltransferase n=1 Tax=Oncorhynchus tshawytscha TaxID=74940 RepID=A0A8C8M4U6_ONCTS
MGRDNILTFAVLCLYHAWTLGVDSTMVRPDTVLDMARSSVDDAYKGCVPAMLTKVKVYLSDEITANTDDFGTRWTDHYDATDKESDGELTVEHIVAIKLYSGIFYKTLNDAVCVGKDKSKAKTFEFYAWHFLLSDAIRILEDKNHPNECLKTVYRGTKRVYKGQLNQEIRFGKFLSTSTSQTFAAESGTENCFEIETCLCGKIYDHGVT